jgi:entericidin B
MACRLLIQRPIDTRKTTREKARKEVTMIRKILPIFMIVGILGIAACNTVHGLGQDIERGGEKTQDAADAVKKKL